MFSVDPTVSHLSTNTTQNRNIKPKENYEKEEKKTFGSPKMHAYVKWPIFLERVKVSFWVDAFYVEN